MSSTIAAGSRYSPGDLGSSCYYVPDVGCPREPKVDPSCRCQSCGDKRIEDRCKRVGDERSSRSADDTEARDQKEIQDHIHGESHSANPCGYTRTTSPGQVTSEPPAPQSYYGAHKFLAERYVAWSGIEHAIARPSNVYGPEQPASGEGAVIAALVSAVQHSSTLVVHGDGTQRRDFLHVLDLVSALLILGDCGVSGMWNVASGVTTSVLELVRHLEELAGRPLKVTRSDPRPGDIHDSCLTSDRMRQLGWSPQVSLGNGLRQMLQEARS